MQDADADRQRRLDLASALLNFMNGFADDMAFARPASWFCPSLDHMCHGNRCDDLASVEMSYAAAKDRCERVGRQLDDVMAAPPFNIPRKKTARQRLKQLSLYSRKIDDSGMEQLALFLASGALPALTLLALDDNMIGDEGMIKFSEACAMGAMASLQQLVMNDGPLGVDHPMLKAACQKQGITLR